MVKLNVADRDGNVETGAVESAALDGDSVRDAPVAAISSGADKRSGRRSRRTATKELALPLDANAFDRRVFLTVFSTKTNTNTRLSYWGDYRIYQRFFIERGFDPADPPDETAAFFIEWLKARGEAPKTRARRISALSAIYRRLCRSRKDGEPFAKRNPFSTDQADREKAQPLRPTRLANCALVRRMLSSCDATDFGVRDAAIVRVFWKTGMRRISLLSMTFERLERERDLATGEDQFIAMVIGKGGTDERVLLAGKAANALERWLVVLEDWGVHSGAIWRRTPEHLLTARDLGHMFARRMRLVGARPGALTPHQFRVSFATRNPASLEQKQDALGHADPATTMLYDRSSWKGRAAFAAMPEVEDVE